MPCVERLCTNCGFRLMEDNGYSNYTVEGTTLSCLRGVHPTGPFDHFYGGAPEARYAEECTLYFEGEGINVDVEQEALETLSGAQMQLMQEYRTIKLISG